jgi:hypothetical protein
MHGYHVRAVKAAGVTYAMVSDLPEETMVAMLRSGLDAHRTEAQNR